MHAHGLSWIISPPTLVLIAQAIFILEDGWTDRETDAAKNPTLHGESYWRG